MLAGFSAEAIDDMDPERRSRLLWAIHARALHERSLVPMQEGTYYQVLNVAMFPPGDRPKR